MTYILIINHSNPFAHGGGSYACHAYTKAFAEWAQGNADLLIDTENQYPLDNSIRVKNLYEVSQRPLLERLLSIISGDIQRYTRFVQKHLRKYPNRYSHVIINGSFEAGALVDLFHSYNIKVVSIHHNYDPDFVRDNYKHLTSFFVRHAYNLQKRAYLRSDYNLFLTQDDIDKCKSVYGENACVNKLLGVFEFDKIPSFSYHEKNDRIKFVITGSLCTVQGIDGVMYFFKKLYKYLPSDCEIIVAGRSPSYEIVTTCKQHKNVTLIANPVNMKDVISNGDIYICPTRLGGGLKLRIMDGLKLGLPVVTHACSARGYEAFCGTNFFYSFNDPIEFSNSVNAVVKNMRQNLISSRMVYDAYANMFSYDSGLERVKNIMK